MNKYIVMFTEQDFACNANNLTCSNSGKRYIYTVEADKIYDAYYKAIELVRKDTKELVILNLCMLKDYFFDFGRYHSKERMPHMFNWLGYAFVSETVPNHEDLELELESYFEDLKAEARADFDDWLEYRGLEMVMGIVVKKGRC